MYSAEDFVQRIEANTGAALEPESLAEIDHWMRGRILATVSQEAWGEIMAAMRSISDDLTKQLLETVPGDKDRIVSYHAAAYAAAEMVTNFDASVQSAIRFAETVPRVVLEGIADTGPGPIDCF